MKKLTEREALDLIRATATRSQPMCINLQAIDRILADVDPWIPCTTVMPPIGYEVIAYDPDWYTPDGGFLSNPRAPTNPARMANNICHHWTDTGGRWAWGQPTHWMYKPAAPTK